MNQTMHEQSESHNGTPHLPSTHASMLASWLLRLILIVSWYPQSRGAFGAAASGIESKSKKTATSPTSTRAPGAGLVEETDNKETVASDVEILKTFGHELAGMISGGEMIHSADHEMARHEKHAEPAVDKNWYVFNVTQLLDPPDGHVSQYDDPLDTPKTKGK